MEIVVTEVRGRVPVTVLTIRGPITANAELERAAQAAYDAGARAILLDLAGVPYIATFGLRAIHFIYSLFRGDSAALPASGAYRSPRLKLLKPSAHALEVLKVAGYDLFLEIYRDYDDAIAAF